MTYINKKNLKRILLALFILSAGAISFSQEENGESPDLDTNGSNHLFGSTWTRPKSAKEFWSQVSPFINIGAAVTLNTESSSSSAPSPVDFAFSFGAIWPNNAFVSFQPRLSFWMTYYLWNGEAALPAEVENRTATALNFMLDFPAAFTFRFEKCQVEAGTGLGFLIRAAPLSRGVSGDDSGASGSARGDRDEIQKYFWSKCRFLYPEFFAAWEYCFGPKIKAGFELRYYLPLGYLVSGRGLDGSIFNISAKLIF